MKKFSFILLLILFTNQSFSATTSGNPGYLIGSLVGAGAGAMIITRYPNDGMNIFLLAAIGVTVGFSILNEESRRIELKEIDVLTKDMIENDITDYDIRVFNEEIDLLNSSILKLRNSNKNLLGADDFSSMIDDYIGNCSHQSFKVINYLFKLDRELN